MVQFDYALDNGFVVTLTSLRSVLQRMSHEDHQWVVVSVPHTVGSDDGELHNFVTIGFSNPGEQSQNYIAFLFPMVLKPDLVPTSDNILVCMHPETASPLCPGLYPGEGGVRVDFTEDWHRFWTPLKAALVAEHEVASSEPALTRE